MNYDSIGRITVLLGTMFLCFLILVTVGALLIDVSDKQIEVIATPMYYKGIEEGVSVCPVPKISFPSQMGKYNYLKTCSTFGVCE